MEYTKLHEAWNSAVKANRRDADISYYNMFTSLKIPTERCEYEGYEILFDCDVKRAKAIEAWLTIMDTPNRNEYDCEIYSDYIERYGAFSYFVEEAKDYLYVCNERNAWQQAAEQGTIKAYQTYVNQYPKGLHARYAQGKLNDWTAWQSARKRDNYLAYLEYFKNFPNGDSAELAQKELIPTASDAVDLGLPSGTRWAPFNVGAFFPEEYGDYYAWGETQTKSNYSWYYYQYFTDKNGNGTPWTIINGKAEIDSGELLDFGNDISGTQYDVAHVKWGDDWKMPTKAQCQELVNKCKWTWWITQDLQEGYKVTGPNGNSIFLPAAGFRDNRNIARDGFRGGYWSSTRERERCQNAYLLRFKQYDAFALDPDLHDVFANVLHYGRTVRPVTNVKPKQQTATTKQIPSFPIDTNITEGTPVINVSGHNAVDLGLPSGTKWADCNIGSSSPIDYGDYFAWGETRTKRSFEWKTYKYAIDKNRNGKYDYGEKTIDIGTDISGTDYDVAHVKWGGSWMMPTKEQWQELIDCCTWTLTAQGGRKGYKVTGPNGRVIFLPAAGHIWGTEGNRIGKMGEYWFATPTNHYNMLSFDVDKNEIYISGRAEFAGVTVRPVTK